MVHSKRVFYVLQDGCRGKLRGAWQTVRWHEDFLCPLGVARLFLKAVLVVETSIAGERAGNYAL